MSVNSDNSTNPGGSDRLPDLATFGERFSWAADRAKVRNQIIAEAAKVSVVTVSRWRSGMYEPEPDKIPILVDLLTKRGVPVTDRWLRPAPKSGAPQLMPSSDSRRRIAQLRVELIDMDCNDQEIDAAIELITVPQAVDFVATAHPPQVGRENDQALAIDFMERAVREELLRRRKRAKPETNTTGIPAAGVSEVVDEEEAAAKAPRRRRNR